MLLASSCSPLQGLAHVTWMPRNTCSAILQGVVLEDLHGLYVATGMRFECFVRMRSWRNQRGALEVTSRTNCMALSVNCSMIFKACIINDLWWATCTCRALVVLHTFRYLPLMNTELEPGALCFGQNGWPKVAVEIAHTLHNTVSLKNQWLSKRTRNMSHTKPEWADQCIEMMGHSGFQIKFMRSKSTQGLVHTKQENRQLIVSMSIMC